MIHVLVYVVEHVLLWVGIVAGILIGLCTAPERTARRRPKRKLTTADKVAIGAATVVAAELITDKELSDLGDMFE